MPHSRKQTVIGSAVVFAASALLSAGLPIAVSVATAAASAPPFEPDADAANYSGVVFLDATGNVVTSGTNLSSPFAYAVASTAADTGANKASLAFANPQHGVAPSSWSPVAGEGGPTQFSPSSMLPAGTPADIVAFAPTYPVVTASGANITSWLTAVGAGGLDTTAGYANTIQVRLTDSGPLGHGNPAGTYWESDIGFNTTSLAITVDGTTVPANGWAQLYPFQTPSTTMLVTSAAGGTLASGSPITLTATVATNPGSVQFFDNGTYIPNSITPATSGTAAFTYTPAPGSHSYTASYVPGPPPGDPSGTPSAVNETQVAGSTSSAVPVTVGAVLTPTTTSINSSVNPSVFGQSVTFTATVAPTSGTGTPTGTVTFKDGTTTIGMVNLASGMASFTTSALAVTSHVITAAYGGDSTFAASTGSLTGNPQVVNAANTTTAVASSVDPSVFGQSVTFTATVTAVSPGAGNPTGTVMFLDGGTQIGTGTLSSGMASYATSTLAISSHTITTSYPGDGNFNGSTGSLTGNPQVVNKANTTTAVTSSANPSGAGQSVTFTSTVNAVSPGAGSPTGMVTFSDGGSAIGTGTLSGGVATFTTSALNVSSHTIAASYPGDGNFNASTGSLTGNPQVVVNVPPPPAPPEGSVSFKSASTSPSGTAMATNAGTTVTGSGIGSFTLAQYGSNPAGPPAFTPSGEYFDVRIASGSQFPSLTIRDCNLNGGNALVWWDAVAGRWQPVVGSPGPTFSAGPPPCVTVTLNTTTSPNLAQLEGTIFGVAQAAPGYWLVGSDGGVFTFGVGFYGSLGATHLNRPIVGMAPTHARLGYWLAGGDGGVFTFGDATFYGSMGAAHLNQPVVAIAATPGGLGYYLVAADGGVFTFGDAVYYGSTATMHLNAPIVGIVPTPSGLGYWLVAKDGGVFTFGDAVYYGSMGSRHLNAPILGAVLSTGGHGYYLVAADGGVFTFGDAMFYGSSGGAHLNAPTVAMAVTTTGMGYRLFSSDGGVFDFGDATYQGSIPGNGTHLNGAIVAGA